MRSNNVSESYNSRLTRVSDCVHPNIYKYINFVKKEEALTKNKMQRVDLNVFKVRATKYQLVNEKIINLKLKYEKGDFESHFDYLMQCSAFIKDYTLE